MFGNMGQMLSMLGNVGKVREMMEKVSQQLKEMRLTGSAGGGMVEVDVSGAREPLACRIAPAMFTDPDREMIEDLVTSAMVDAMNRATETQRRLITDAAGELGIPGLADMIGNAGFPGIPGM